MQFVNPVRFFFIFLGFLVQAASVVFLLAVLNLGVAVVWATSTASVGYSHAIGCTLRSMGGVLHSDVMLPAYVELVSEASNLLVFGIIVAAAIEALKD
ncbi:hypothetical protein HJO_01100 [Hyphomonas johnsonii MHS-2]|uniref:Uncharacterized protein n=1 Tax=Hyphomonas johnsonii MHS-2 TaxID=1280950 RepID=A0A059FTD3_9PROT|nr:hypothetical protein HJO_01100 [Hyphomonas johnsonii MHS-2]